MSQAEADVEGWRGTDEGGKLKETSTTHWISPNTGATNESGFTALPGGSRNYYKGEFNSMGYHAHFWSSTEKGRGSTTAWNRFLPFDSSKVFRHNYQSRDGFSVRCIRD